MIVSPEALVVPLEVKVWPSKRKSTVGGVFAYTSFHTFVAHCLCVIVNSVVVAFAGWKVLCVLSKITFCKFFTL